MYIVTDNWINVTGDGEMKPSWSQIHSPLLEDKVDHGIGLSYRLAASPYVAWPAGTTNLYAIVNFIPPVRNCELGLCSGDG